MKILFKVINIAFAITALSFLSCDVKSPVEDVKMLIGANPIETLISVSAVNGSTMQPLGFNGSTPLGTSSLLNVGIFGSSAGFVRDVKNQPLSAISSSFGMFNFAVAQSFTPSESNPLSLNLTINVPGFLPANLPITLMSPGGHSFTCSMVSLASPPEGVHINTGIPISTNQNGTLTAVTLRATDDPSMGVELTIPQGTKFFAVGDVSHSNPLTGNFQTTVAYFDPTKETALRAFPGGFFVDTDKGPGLFSTAGFAVFEIYQGSTKVGSFDKSASLSMIIPSSIKKYDGSPVQNGDEIPLWSMNIADGLWNEEDSGILTNNGYGSFTVTSKINHLSYWNWDWFQGSYCSYGMNLCVQGCFTSVLLKVYNQTTGAFLKSYWVSSSDPCVRFLYVPRNLPVRIEAWTSWSGTKVGSINITDLCGADMTFPINVTGAQNVDVTVEGYCPDDPDVMVRPNIDIWIYDYSDGWRYGGFMRNGHVTFNCLKIPNTYIFGVWYDDNWYDEPYDVTQTTYYFSMEFPQELCD